MRKIKETSQAPNLRPKHTASHDKKNITCDNPVAPAAHRFDAPSSGFRLADDERERERERETSHEDEP